MPLHIANIATTVSRLLTMVMLTLLLGCATGPHANPSDPLEPFNRTMFDLNDGIDKAVLRPVAVVYRDLAPSPIREGVANFFGNLSDIWSLVNNVLQGKPSQASDQFFRVLINTLWGLGGIFDVATALNIERHREDFGQTLGHWGVASGPYLVLPLLGPSSVRDSLGLIADIHGDVLLQATDIPVRNSLLALRTTDDRASLLAAGQILDEAALDRYSLIRDIYLRRRADHVIDGLKKSSVPESQATEQVLPTDSR